MRGVLHALVTLWKVVLSGPGLGHICGRGKTLVVCCLYAD